MNNVRSALCEHTMLNKDKNLYNTKESSLFLSTE